MKKSLVEKHFDRVAANYDYGKNKYSYYYNNLKKLLGSLIPKGKKVYEIGCGTGDLLASLKPKYGYGMDISARMAQIAKLKYHNSKNLYFSTKWSKEKFNYIFMSDVIEHLENSKETFQKISKLMDKNTTLICTMANPLWEPFLVIWEKLGWKMKEGPHKRPTFGNLRLLIEECGMKIIKHDYKLLVPVEIPFLTGFANKNLEKYFRKLAFIEYLIAVKS